MFRRFRLVVLALPIVAGCYTEGTLDAPDLSNNNGLFTRFVAIGTSISVRAPVGRHQRQHPAALLPGAGGRAGRGQFRPPQPEHARVPRAVRQQRDAGACRRPHRAPVQPARVADPATKWATSRSRVSRRPTSSPTSGSPTSTYERLQVFFLGGQTPWNAVKAADPTFLSIEIGSSDVIGAVSSLPNPGDPDSITPYPVFAENYTRFADSVATLNTKVVAFTIPDVTQIPYTSRGSTYWCLKTGLCPGVPVQFPGQRTRSATTARQVRRFQARRAIRSWCRGPLAWPGLLRASSPPFTPFTLDCSNTDQVVTPEEFAYVRTTTEQMNQLIRDQAAAHGWALVEAGDVFATLAPGIPPFPDLSAVPTGGSINFGPYFSLDGFHPSSATHRVIADAMIAKINEFYDTQIPAAALGREVVNGAEVVSGETDGTAASVRFAFPASVCFTSSRPGVTSPDAHDPRPGPRPCSRVHPVRAASPAHVCRRAIHAGTRRSIRREPGRLGARGPPARLRLRALSQRATLRYR